MLIMQLDHFFIKKKGSEIDSKMGKEKYRKKEKKREEELERY